MSYFDGHDVDDVPDDPNALPDDTYKFIIISAEAKETASKDKTGITFKYQIIEGPWSSYFPIVDWVRVPDKNTKPDEVTRMLSYLKMRLLAFGFTPEEIQEFSPGDEEKCINKAFFGTTRMQEQKNDSNRKNAKVYKFDPINDGEGLEEFLSDKKDKEASF